MPNVRACLTTWKNGTSENDIALGVTGGYDGLVVLAGLTNGSWTEANLGGNDSFAVMLDVKNAIFETPAPTMIATTPPTSYTPPPSQLERSSSSKDLLPSPLYSATFSPTSSVSDSDAKSELSSVITIITVVSVVLVIVLLAFGVMAFIRRRRKAQREKFGAIPATFSGNPDSSEPVARGRRFINLSSWNRHTVLRSNRSLANQERAASTTSLPLTGSGSEIRMKPKDLARPLALVENIKSFTGQSKATKPIPTRTAEDEKDAESSYSDFNYDPSRVNPTSGHYPESSEGRNLSQVSLNVSSRVLASVALDGVGGADAVQDAAHILANGPPLPVVSEAASLVSILAKLIENSPGNVARRQAKIKRCWSILKMLGRAAEVLGKVMSSMTNNIIPNANIYNWVWFRLRFSEAVLRMTFTRFSYLSSTVSCMFSWSFYLLAGNLGYRPNHAGGEHSAWGRSWCCPSPSGTDKNVSK